MAYSVVRTAREVHPDPQVLANGYLQLVDVGPEGSFTTVSSPVIFDNAATPVGLAPGHGENTDECYSNLATTGTSLSSSKPKE
jgi:crotonobetainyl-CoA:carnitine CoA-transferase CaiB-like acyl-CoA transferase